jgi:hypothetical protein
MWPTQFWLCSRVLNVRKCELSVIMMVLVRLLFLICLCLEQNYVNVNVNVNVGPWQNSMCTSAEIYL